MTDVTRRDFHVITRDNISIAIREVKQAGNQDRVPMILLHGTRIPGLSEFDLNVPNGSLAEDLAKQGHIVYIVDARGFGRSERPAEMDKPRQPGKRTLVRTIEITRDVDAAVEHLIEATGCKKVGLFGWGVGGTCIQMYASLHPDKVSHLVFYNTIYGGYKWPTRSTFAHPDDIEKFDQEKNGNYNFNTIELLEEHWDKQIPIEDKVAWRDPEMVKAFSQALLDGDPTSMERTPPSYRSANGMLEDLFRMSRGQKLMHANQIYAKVMIINPDLDTMCKTEDMDAMVEDLCHAEQVLVYAPKNTTHYILLDRPERGRDALLARMNEFLN